MKDISWYKSQTKALKDITEDLAQMNPITMAKRERARDISLAVMNFALQLKMLIEKPLPKFKTGGTLHLSECESYPYLSSDSLSAPGKTMRASIKHSEIINGLN